MTAGEDNIYDLFVIGGGINGAAVACDAAGRGLAVALAEMHDFAEGTSSRSNSRAAPISSSMGSRAARPSRR